MATGTDHPIVPATDRDAQQPPDRSILSATTNTEHTPATKKAELLSQYHELGLGRGVNVTDPKMWKNKTSFFVIRAHSENDIDITQECGLLERYKTEVATFSSQSQSVQASLENPTSNVKIGMDEYYSRSSSSKQIIVGQKIEKRTIAFKVNYQDELPCLPCDSIIDEPRSAPKNYGGQDFEKDLASWLLKYFFDRNNTIDKEQAIEKLALRLCDADSTTILLKGCAEFINHLGITHYVSAIKLGACHYHIVSSMLKEKWLGVGATSAASSLAKGRMASISREQLTQMAEEEQKIGRINEREGVDSEDEAVIEFEIQPLYKLLKIHFIHEALKEAIKRYIRAKMDNTSKSFTVPFAYRYIIKRNKSIA